ncbi:MAG: DUF4224 domain-containing protein [Limnobacter sp.]|uniref:DUF4224 domain-containing protein n=1 Tax=Limnobacter sp. TaxID=2003368 RepID=UPI00391CC70A
MRLSPQKLYEATGRIRQSAQARWFKEYLGVDVPRDRLGPIITEAAYEDLVKKRLGVLQLPANPAAREHPKVRLLAKSS